MDFNFAEYYKRLSDTELLDILDNAGAYQPLAIEAANNELDHRKLTQTEVEEARLPLLATRLKKETRIEKGKALEQKMKTISESVFNSVKPHDTKEDTTNKIISFVIIVYGLYFIKSLPIFFRVFKGLFEKFSDYPFRFLIFLLPEIIIPPALITFWKRKSIGWTLLASCITFTVVADLIMMYESSKVIAYHSYHDLHRIPVKATDLFELFINVSALYVLCRGNIRNIYKIDIAKMSGIIFISAVLSFVIIFSIL